MTKYERFLNDDCKISFHWYKSDDHKALKWRDLTGGEKHRLFKCVNLCTLFPLIPKVKDIQNLWSSFYNLIKRLNSNHCESEKFSTDAKKWINDFCSIYQTRHVTPYAHALGMHVSEFIHLYGNITKFKEQGLQKLNDLTTTHYMRSTNHKDMGALHQLILKRNRMENLECDGYDYTKRICTCSICGQPGHNRRHCLKVNAVVNGPSFQDQTQELKRKSSMLYSVEVVVYLSRKYAHAVIDIIIITMFV